MRSSRTWLAPMALTIDAIHGACARAAAGAVFSRLDPIAAPVAAWTEAPSTPVRDPAAARAAAILVGKKPQDSAARAVYPLAVAIGALPFAGAGWLVGQLVPMSKTSFVPRWP